MSEQEEPRVAFLARTGHEDDEFVVYDETEHGQGSPEDRLEWRDRLEGRDR